MDSKIARSQTHQINVGGIKIGGGAPVVVQSMTCAPLINDNGNQVLDVDATLTQINSLVAHGCELVRVAIPNSNCIASFAKICAKSSIPIIADIHFDYRLAIAACKNGASAIRINPGNIGSLDKVDAIIDAARQAQIPVRIGVNEGSLQKEIAADCSLSQADKLVQSAVAFVEHFQSQNFDDIIVSIKSHDVSTCINACLKFAKLCPSVPQHLGITEAGTLRQGTIKSSVGLGTLFAQGIGDTIRVSLTADPCEEVDVAYAILQSLGLRHTQIEIISCPTCSRTHSNLIEIVNKAEQHFATLPNKNLKVAIMGCEVNGPGEAKNADIGLAFGKDCALLFKHGKVIEKIDTRASN
ncbi:MAG: flavodoxin-dependent (E)-4-hydroxy-3-methylbut-2-enyl-diphosphate synthase, partial [Coriobacteriales bacterium]|nr:flavodoxin-dependent (E)-4-hydroxy-3-methylbut-2-enyl-diphosphate synthase [Coriobacteriales bacterium]